MDFLFSETSNILSNISLNSFDKNLTQTSKRNNRAFMTVLEENCENDPEEVTEEIISERVQIKNEVNKIIKKPTETGLSLNTKKNNRNVKYSKEPKKKNQSKITALFIGGLGPKVTEENLKDTFNKYLSLTSVKICFDVETRKSLGYGYLNFKDKTDVELCIEDYNYREVFGNEIKIMPSLRNSVYRKNIGTNVFFSNLPLEDPKLTTRVFYDIFKEYGKILSCKLDKRKNIGFVYFEDDKAATKAIQDYNNRVFFGAKIACGLHFDKELRNFPDFDKRKLNLDKNIIINDEWKIIEKDDPIPKPIDKSLPHPNAIFIKNIPVDTTEDELLEHFSKIGPVKSVFTSDISRYETKWAFITYKKGNDTERAIKELNGTVFKGRPIFVSKAKNKTQLKNRFISKPCILVSNLSTICTKEFLIQLCSQENLHFEDFKVTGYNTISGTFSGIISFKYIDDRERVHNFLKGKLVGGSIIESILHRNDQEIPNSDLSIDGHVEHEQRTPYVPMPLPLNQFEYPFPNQYNWKQVPLFPNSPYNVIQKRSDPRVQNKQNFHVMDILKKQIKRAIDFLRLTVDIKESNIKCVSEYIIKVFWSGDLNGLCKFLLLLNSNIQYEEVLHKQIVESIKCLGFASID